ncbi:putative lipid II flippase FtsW [Suttonella sp. R2A3]|uniref:putative lipid II flippase FtsW n=1 Tax=Suttonella sp. R2A3 TaxID=2908648 RepID=UPI001F15E676|nr:putative lipid II flippase FtsW [Suttonella sp. R2A3]UJF24613.1 putative lipid II flippase FtsW [Suttonella sp. R2A3]
MVNKKPVKQPIKDFHKTQQKGGSRFAQLVFPDLWLILSFLMLLAVGVVAVTSVSMPQAVHEGLSPYHYTLRQAIFMAIGFIGLFLTLYIPSITYRKYRYWILIAAFILMLMAFVPGLGVSVNGSRRWISLGLFNVQVSEVMKLALIVFAAAYLERNSRRLDNSAAPVWVLVIPLLIIVGVLQLQPDLGAAVVMAGVVFALMFLAGARLRDLAALALLGIIGLVGLLMMSGYRRERLATFLDPWAKDRVYDEGYQLVQALIAVGNGRLQGLGLGQSVQKHQFLPEAHTDFIFAIIAEEMGFFGAILVLVLFAVFVWRSFEIALLADRMRKRFASLLAYGIGLWVAIQTLINIGVSIGALPTKGITLPFISYGGSSLIMMMIAVGVLLRIDAESRFQARREGMDV